SAVDAGGASQPGFVLFESEKGAGEVEEHGSHGHALHGTGPGPFLDVTCTTLGCLSGCLGTVLELVWGSLTAAPRGAFPRGDTPRPPGHVLPLASSRNYATREPTQRGIHVERRSYLPWQGWSRKTVPYGHSRKSQDG